MNIDLSTTQSIMFIFISILLVIVLMKVLAMVHHQTRRVKDLEMRMKAMENMDAEEEQSTTEGGMNG